MVRRNLGARHKSPDDGEPTQNRARSFSSVEVEASVAPVATVDSRPLRTSGAAHGDCLALEVDIPVAIARVGT